MSISDELEEAHEKYVSAINALTTPKGFDVSVSVGCVAYGKSNDISEASRCIDKLESNYKSEIGGWRKALVAAEKCLEIRKEQANDQ